MNPDQTARKVGDRLREIRTSKHLTQEDVAKKANMSKNYYARFERGEVSASLEKLEGAVYSLGIKSSDILPF